MKVIVVKESESLEEFSFQDVKSTVTGAIDKVKNKAKKVASEVLNKFDIAKKVVEEYRSRLLKNLMISFKEAGVSEDKLKQLQPKLVIALDTAEKSCYSKMKKNKEFQEIVTDSLYINCLDESIVAAFATVLVNILKAVILVEFGLILCKAVLITSIVAITGLAAVKVVEIIKTSCNKTASRDVVEKVISTKVN